MSSADLPTAIVAPKLIYRLVVTFLGLLTLIGICGGIYLAANKIDQPEILLALGSAAVGALAGLLAPSPGK